MEAMKCVLCDKRYGRERDFDLVSINQQTNLVGNTRPEDKTPDKVYHVSAICCLLAEQLLKKDAEVFIFDTQVQGIYQYVEGRYTAYLLKSHLNIQCKQEDLSERTKKLASRLLTSFYRSTEYVFKDDNSIKVDENLPRSLKIEQILQIKREFLAEESGGVLKGFSDCVPSSNGKQALFGLGIFAAFSYCSYKVYGALSSWTDEESNGQVPTRNVLLPSGFVERV
ncbi:MAG: hypothetical protein KDK63_04340 [Chlamydiia bacterium]|nr:hypothetical protein [Chlamydiia bacterium]